MVPGSQTAKCGAPESKAATEGKHCSNEEPVIQLFAELEHIYRTAPVGLCLMDCDLRFVRINDLLADLNGLPAQDHIGKRLHEVLPDMIDEIEPRYREVIETGNSVLNSEVCRANPEAPSLQQFYLVSYHAFKGDADKVLGVGTVVQDITDRKLAERALRQQEQLLRDAERNAKLGSWRLDLLSRTVEWSDEMFRIFDISTATQPTIEVFFQCVHPDDRQRVRGRFNDRLASDTACDEIEYRIVRGDGEVRDILAIAGFVRAESGEPLAVYGTAQDFTEWRKTERALRKSEENLRSILDTATDIVMSLDLEGNILYINHVVPGFDREQVIGTSVFDYLLEEGRDAFRKAMDQVQATRAPHQYEVEGAGPDGSAAWYLSRMGPVLRDQELVGFTLLTSDISKRRRAESALRENEQFFRTIFEQAAVGVALIDTNTGRFIRVNDKYAALVGYPANEMREKTFMDISHPDDLPADLENMRRLHAGEIREFGMEKRLIRSDGTGTWFHLTVSPTWAVGEEPRYHVAIMKDISSRKQAEQAIRASEQKYRQLIETTQEGVWVIDVDGATTFVNERMAELLGFSCEDMLGRHLFDFMDEVAKQEAMRKLERRKHGIKEQHDFRLQRKDGTDVWTSMSTNPLVNEDGKHVGALAMVTDITSRKQMEWELKTSHDQLESRVQQRTSELIASRQRLLNEIAERTRIDEERERLSAIIEATPDFVGFSDLEGHVLYLNRSARGALGVPDDARLEKFQLCDFHPEPAVKMILETAFPATLRDGSWKGEVAWLSRDGREIPTAMVLQAHYSADGEVELISTIAHDISELRDAEKALQRAERLASIGTLAAGIAHEINNPLGAMLLTAEHALGKLDERVVIEESLADIVSHVERCAQIVRSVLQFSRDGYSKKSPNDLIDVLRRAIDLTRQQAQQTGVQVDLDAVVDEYCLTINPLEMEQVFVNLIANAVQSSNSGGRVLVKVSTTDERARVIVEDQGVGVPAELRARLFDPFFTTRLHSGGTGLGLSIVHGIVRDHGGGIDVWSEPDRGTCMTVTLPRIQKRQIDAQIARH